MSDKDASPLQISVDTVKNVPAPTDEAPLLSFNHYGHASLIRRGGDASPRVVVKDNSQFKLGFKVTSVF